MNIEIYKVKPNFELNQKLFMFVENGPWNNTKENTAKMILGNDFGGLEYMFVVPDGNKIVGHESFMKTDYYSLPDIFP